MRRKRGKKGTTSDDARAIVARPLDSFFFLLPLIIFYQAAVMFGPLPGAFRDPGRVVAVEMLNTFFDLFGTRGALLPPLVVVVILLATHIASRQPWVLRGRVVGLMYVESIVWALPLIAINRYTHMSAMTGSRWVSELALCVGAGIYEELVFRLVLISLLVIVGADLLGFSHSATTVGAVLTAAFVFALHHHPPFGTDPFNVFRFSFRTLAGVYLGVIFVLRGYGPAVGAHVGYNVLAVVMARW